MPSSGGPMVICASTSGTVRSGNGQTRALLQTPPWWIAQGSSPTAASRIYAFVRGANGHLLVNFWNGSKWQSADQGRSSQNTTMVDSPGVIAYGSDHNLCLRPGDQWSSVRELLGRLEVAMGRPGQAEGQSNAEARGHRARQRAESVPSSEEPMAVCTSTSGTARSGSGQTRAILEKVAVAESPGVVAHGKGSTPSSGERTIFSTSTYGTVRSGIGDWRRLGAPDCSSMLAHDRSCFQPSWRPVSGIIWLSLLEQADLSVSSRYTWMACRWDCYRFPPTTV